MYAFSALNPFTCSDRCEPCKQRGQYKQAVYQFLTCSDTLCRLPRIPHGT